MYNSAIIRFIPSFQKEAHKRCGAVAWHRLSRSTQQMLEAFPGSNPCFDWVLVYAQLRMEGEV